MPGDERTLEVRVARHLDAAPEDIRLGRIPTGRFNESSVVEGDSGPLVLPIGPPDDPSRMLSSGTPAIPTHLIIDHAPGRRGWV